MKYLSTLFLLCLTLVSCQTSRKTSSEEDTSTKAETIRTFYIAPVKTIGVGVAPRECLLVKQKSEDKWSLFYDNIKGFTYERGYTYIIKVKETERPNPPADASSLQYELVKIVEQNQVSQDFAQLYDIYGVLAINGRRIKEGVFQSLELNTKEMTFRGDGGCNSFKGKLEQSGEWNGIIFSQLISTRKTCPEQALENSYLNALKSVTSYYRYNNSLLLFAGDNLVIEATRMD